MYVIRYINPFDSSVTDVSFVDKLASEIQDFNPGTLDENFYRTAIILSVLGTKNCHIFF